MNKFAKKVAYIACALAGAAGASAHAQSLTFETLGGQVTGVRNVNVGGTFYDVTFGDAIPTTFMFTTADSARAASQALVDQVFVGSAPQNLDRDPGALHGCSQKTVCWVYTTFAPNRADVAGKPGQSHTDTFRNDSS